MRAAYLLGLTSFPSFALTKQFSQRTARRRIAGLSNTRLPPFGRQRRNGSPPQWFPIDASRPIQSAESAVAIEIWQSWQTLVCPDSSLPPDARENTQLAANFPPQAPALCLARACPDRAWSSGGNLAMWKARVGCSPICKTLPRISSGKRGARAYAQWAFADSLVDVDALRFRISDFYRLSRSA